MSTPLVLASASPRRADLLRAAGIDFVVRPTATDESVHVGERPVDYVLRVAQAKARAAARPGDLLMAADTTVAIDGEILGKPRDDADAARMLRRLSGRTHVVYTAVVLRDDRSAPPTVHEEVVATEVTMRHLDDDAIAWYVATGEPHDKAGAYALQGAANLFIERVEGSPSNVIGLPMATVALLLARAGSPVHGGRTTAGQ